MSTSLDHPTTILHAFSDSFLVREAEKGFYSGGTPISLSVSDHTCGVHSSPNGVSPFPIWSSRKAEAGSQLWVDALADLEPEATIMTRAFTGRLGRSIETDSLSGPVRFNCDHAPDRTRHEGHSSDATLGRTKRSLRAPRICGGLRPPHVGSSRKASTLMQ